MGHRDVARQDVVERRDVRRALDRGMPAQRHDPAPRPADIAEQELDDRIFELRAKMLADTAEGSGEVTREEAKCPDCGSRMVRKGKKKRRLLLREGQEVELKREYLVCLECGRGLFPPR